MMALADVLTRLAVVYLAAAGSPPPASRSSRHPSRPAPVPELASGPHSPTIPDKAPPTAAPYSCTPIAAFTSSATFFSTVGLHFFSA